MEAYQNDVAPDKPLDDLLIMCSWCGFMMRFGRGPTSHGICKPCKLDFFPDVPEEVGNE